MSSKKSRLTSIATLLVGAALFATACTAHPHRHHRVAPKVVVIHKSHVHSRSCGHYLHRGRWYYVKGHVHRHACGHVHVAGVWRLR